jgi:hypothetical protein
MNIFLQLYLLQGTLTFLAGGVWQSREFKDCLIDYIIVSYEY